MVLDCNIKVVNWQKRGMEQLFRSGVCLMCNAAVNSDKRAHKINPVSVSSKLVWSDVSCKKKKNLTFC